MIAITIDGKAVNVPPDSTILAAARALGLDIPTLCYLEKCGPLTSCLVCLVKVNGKLVPSCGTRAEPGMVVESETEEVHEARRTALELLFADHVGDCLSPCHRLCPLGLNIPVMIRQIQAGQLAEAGATVRNALPLAGVLGRLCHHPCEQGCRRGTFDNPAAIRDMERFLTDQQIQNPVPETRSQPTELRGRGVAVVGAGPAGLSAAWFLARQGHRVTVMDRQARAGGSLCRLPESELPAAVLDEEIRLLARLGIEFRLGVHLSREGLEQLSGGFDAVVLAFGELAAGEGQALGLAVVGNFLKADPNTCQTPMERVFAAGAAVKAAKHLVRALSEGRAAAECVHRFLNGQSPRRPEKPFSSVMGRLDPGELRLFLAAASAANKVSPCDRCAGFNRQEATAEAARCLHCDCRSSGNCLFQHYAQVYGVDANRFRTGRRPFVQSGLDPDGPSEGRQDPNAAPLQRAAGVIFEPGKCILCGICVKLTELAREPLGLTFVGRGFDVRICAPFDQAIADGLESTAEECVRHCPTGALVFRKPR